MSDRTPATSRQARRERFAATQPRKRHPILPVAMVALLLMATVLGASIFFGQGRAADAEHGQGGLKAATTGHAPYPEVMAEDGVVRLPIATFDDGQARHYTYMHGERPIEFFVVRSDDGTVRAAFNACDVCYWGRKGYTQDGDVMVCNNCGQRFPMDRINVEQGGCNPAPLNRTVNGDDLIIQVGDIVAGADYF